MKAHLSDLSIVSPANYRISVVGFLDESYSDRLSGLTIRNTKPDHSEGKPVTTLIGILADQAALFGVLNALYNMRMPLIEVEYLSNKNRKKE